MKNTGSVKNIFVFRILYFHITDFISNENILCNLILHQFYTFENYFFVNNPIFYTTKGFYAN